YEMIGSTDSFLSKSLAVRYTGCFCVGLKKEFSPELPARISGKPSLLRSTSLRQVHQPHVASRPNALDFSVSVSPSLIKTRKGIHSPAIYRSFLPSLSTSAQIAELIIPGESKSLFTDSVTSVNSPPLFCNR